jgi:HAD superfamily hydrolase (TIGR01509 family)
VGTRGFSYGKDYFVASILGVILDMDGVLVDSEPFIQEAGIRLFAEKGFQVKPEDFAPFVGTGENRYFGGVAEKYGIPFNLEKDKARGYQIYLDLIKGRLQPLPGVFTFVAECRRRKLKVAVASSADAIKVEGNLGEIGLPTNTFDALVNGSQVQKKKPHPDIFLEAASRLGLPAASCLVVEDAVSGVKAAKAAGAWCLALTTSFSAEKLKGADWFARNLAEVPEEIWANCGQT